MREKKIHTEFQDRVNHEAISRNGSLDHVIKNGLQDVSEFVTNKAYGLAITL